MMGTTCTIKTKVWQSTTDSVNYMLPNHYIPGFKWMMDGADCMLWTG